VIFEFTRESVLEGKDVLCISDAQADYAGVVVDIGFLFSQQDSFKLKQVSACCLIVLCRWKNLLLFKLEKVELVELDCDLPEIKA
jgi:hypothetical protein